MLTLASLVLAGLALAPEVPAAKPGASPAVSSPAETGPTHITGGVVVLVSANAEWRVVRERYAPAAVEQGPLGEWFATAVAGRRLVFYHGGWGKIAAAASTQHVIDVFRPALLVNVGTCGGLAGRADAGEVVLARRTVVYDIVERMGDPAEAIEEYSSRAAAEWPARLRARVREGTLVSADQDVDPARTTDLAARYDAVAGDWESGAIAWVAARNHAPLVILRGVSDVVRPSGDELYGAPGQWEQAARATMNRVLDLFTEALPDLAPLPSR
jgi:adenosylhomocysteine nucleosidase